MRCLRTVCAVAFGVLLAAAVPAAAQSATIVEDDLTHPGGAFDADSGGNVAALVFGKGGMTASAVTKGKGIFLTPAYGSGTTEDQLVNASIEFTVTAGNSQTGVGAFCRRNETANPEVVFIKGKTWALYGSDDHGNFVKVEHGTDKSLKQGKATKVRVDCTKNAPQGIQMDFVLTINGKRVITSGETNAPASGTIGLYFEGVGKGRGVATFRDLRIKEIPVPTS